jgi:hypothetical protein
MRGRYITNALIIILARSVITYFDSYTMLHAASDMDLGPMT